MSLAPNLGAADIVLVERVAAIDHDIARGGEIGQLGDRGFGDRQRAA
jgi:hypothetical protein